MSKFKIYALINPLTTKPFYIGVTKNLLARLHQHTRGIILRLPSKNRIKDAVISEIIEAGLFPEVCTIEETDSVETAYYLETLLITQFGRKCNKTGILTNIHPGGRGGRAHPTKDETRQKMSAARLGKTYKEIYGSNAEEMKQLRSKQMSGEGNNMFGRTHTEEARQKISEKVTGKVGGIKSDAHRAAIVESNRTRGVSQETKKKISKAKLGKPNLNGRVPKSEAHKQALSEARKDKTEFTWVNQTHGEITCSRAELKDRYPELKINTGELGQVIKGVYSQHKGWQVTFR